MDIIARINFMVNFLLIIHFVLLSLPIFFMAKNSGADHPYLAFVPIIGLLMLIDLANRPLWLFIFLLVPGLNLLVTAYCLDRAFEYSHRGRVCLYVVISSVFTTFFLPIPGLIYFTLSFGYLVKLSFDHTPLAE